MSIMFRAEGYCTTCLVLSDLAAMKLPANLPDVFRAALRNDAEALKSALLQSPEGHEAVKVKVNRMQQLMKCPEGVRFDGECGSLGKRLVRSMTVSDFASILKEALRTDSYQRVCSERRGAQ